MWLTDKITRENLGIFLEPFATDEVILDVGSGGKPYRHLFPNAKTVDIDASKHPDILADAHELPIQDDMYTLILSTEMLEHCQRPQEVVDELWRVLKPGGTLLLTTRFVFPRHNVPYDYWRFTEDGLRYLFEKWDEVEIRPETKTISTLAVLLQRISYQTNLVKPLKFCILLCAKVCNKMNWLVTKEYGEIQKTSEVNHILTSGYYVVARKY